MTRYRQFGLIPQVIDLNNTTFLNFVHPDDKESVKKAIKEALYERRPYDINFRIVSKDGTERILHSKAEVVFDYNGKPQKMIGTSLDVTERKQMDKAIQTLVKSVVGKTGQEFFDKIVVSMNEWLGTDCAFIGQITDGNNVKALSMQMDGKIDHDFGYTLSDEPTPCGNVIESGFVIYSEGVCKLFPNNKVLLEMKAEGYVGTPLRNKDGNAIGLLWVVSRHKQNLPLRAVEVMDILAAKASSEIERKQIEEYLLDSEEALHIANEEWESSFNALPDHICILDMFGAVTRANKTMRERFEPIHGDLKGLDYRLIYCGTATPDPQPPCAAVLSGSPSVSVETRLPTMDGWQSVSSFPLFNREKKQIGAISVVTDITKRKQTEEELKVLNQYLEQRVAERTADLSKANKGLLIEIKERKQAESALSESKEQIQSILDNSTAIIYIKDTQSKYIFINRQFQDLFHITNEEVAGKTDYDIFPKEMADAFQANDRKVLKAQAPLEMEEVALHNDGPHTYISVKFPLFNLKGIPYALCGISTDINERKKAEEKLLEQKNALEQKNVALSEVLGQIEIEKKQIKDNVVANAENLLLPIIQKLRLKGESRKYVQLLQTNIQELASSFGLKLTEKKVKLTPREIEICNMVKNGLANKEIARLLNITHGTIERHRANIRIKLVSLIKILTYHLSCKHYNSKFLPQRYYVVSIHDIYMTNPC